MNDGQSSADRTASMSEAKSWVRYEGGDGHVLSPCPRWSSETMWNRPTSEGIT